MITSADLPLVFKFQQFQAIMTNAISCKSAKKSLRKVFEELKVRLFDRSQKCGRTWKLIPYPLPIPRILMIPQRLRLTWNSWNF